MLFCFETTGMWLSSLLQYPNTIYSIGSAVFRWIQGESIFSVWGNKTRVVLQSESASAGSRFSGHSLRLPQCWRSPPLGVLTRTVGHEFPVLETEQRPKKDGERRKKDTALWDLSIGSCPAVGLFVWKSGLGKPNIDKDTVQLYICILNIDTQLNWKLENLRPAMW